MKTLLVPVLILGLAGAAVAQTVDEFPLPPGHRAAGPLVNLEGKIWVMGWGPGAVYDIAKIATDGTVEARIPIPAPALGLTAGPDGNLWFMTADAVGKADPATGAVVSYPLPTPSNVPGGITVGPDGALWFREMLPDLSGRIGRITTDGSITMFPQGIFGRPIDQLVTGVDGALWFLGFGQIGRMTPDGLVQEYNLDYRPTSYTSNGIAAAMDGGVWITESAAPPNGGGSPTDGRIARILPDGRMTEFVVVSDRFGLSPGALVTGPDGAVWFSENGNAGFGRLAPSGGLSPFSSAPLNADVRHMIFGPDGNIWFTTGNTSVFRLTLPSQLPCASDSITLCLLNGRFRVQTSWTDSQGHSGFGNVVAGLNSPGSGLMWFFGPENWELQIKVLNGCGVNGNYWVYGAASTDVQYTIQVTDTQAGTVKTYSNPLGTRSPAITDSAAFPGCP